MSIRSLIFEISESRELGEVKESLKWGEPSYSVINGSTIRFDWKAKYPEQYFIFFNCKTKLVDTFRELYSDTLKFQGNRAIVLNINEALPIEQLSHCIEISLKYKLIKDLPLLGG
ncbi:DUF1801 domain-containing protein [Vibrio cholerae]|uniref:DUF1801 domain-containing protein n=1 Tax=Vibrio cholerae TaxID=666 RepID=UPI000E09FB2B|nr:DUF1801 domain-containing protein [Vibrio cholerae]EGR1072196.1 DUF1801 domain-containing protein [Vibrio cholerae]HDZ9290997.1 DUF1801 domain-containing protein [Vibrio cholerae]